jgi:CFEM domain
MSLAGCLSFRCLCFTFINCYLPSFASFTPCLPPMHFVKAFILTAVAVMPTMATPMLQAMSDPSSFAMILMAHNIQALEAIHDTPPCGQICLFDEQVKAAYASRCLSLKGVPRFTCLCRNDAYQLNLDRCFKRHCTPHERMIVLTHIDFLRLMS